MINLKLINTKLEKTTYTIKVSKIELLVIFSALYTMFPQDAGKLRSLKEDIIANILTILNIKYMYDEDSNIFDSDEFDRGVELIEKYAESVEEE